MSSRRRRRPVMVTWSRRLYRADRAEDAPYVPVMLLGRGSLSVNNHRLHFNELKWNLMLPLGPCITIKQKPTTQLLMLEKLRQKLSLEYSLWSLLNVSSFRKTALSATLTAREQKTPPPRSGAERWERQYATAFLTKLWFHNQQTFIHQSSGPNWTSDWLRGIWGLAANVKNKKTVTV